VLASSQATRDNGEVAHIIPDQPRPAPAAEACCGIPMDHQEVFGVRRYECRHRSYHPAIYVNLNTGERVSDENLPYLGGEYDPSGS
jgi:hypothetical protein